eukprot:TRINITY_DN25416_c0_g2_i1.p1 TRINITY_DN25416_c0_g2~~TRINITY_DN25416_c0_g2_i1.p1  ORF type:complete len:350 (+),score=55.25 TRINITY_DN25416_c0_g2_i1:71-1120(+)
MILLIISFTVAIVWIFSPAIWKYIPYGQQVYEYLASGNWHSALKQAILQRNFVGVEKISLQFKQLPNIIQSMDSIQPIFPLEACAIKNSEDLNIAKFLCGLGFDVSAQDENGWSALHYAAAQNNHALIAFLVENSADAKLKDKATPQDFKKLNFKEGGRTPFMIAALSGNFEALETLFNTTKPNLEETDDENRTCVHHACASGSTKCLDFLIQNGADISKITNDGSTILHIGALYGGYSIVEFLMAIKFPVEDLDNEGKSPLFNAIKAQDYESVKLLINKGANVNLVVKSSGLTPLALVDDFQMAAVLEKHGADIFQEIKMLDGEVKTVKEILQDRLSEVELQKLESYD